MTLAASFTALPASASATPQRAPAQSVTIGGAVGAPSTYSFSQLQALPQSTFTVAHRQWSGSRIDTDQGVSIETLVDAAQPTLPSVKNPLLRVTVEVSGDRGRAVTFALGELDPSFGDHPAYLGLEQDGRPLPAPELVVPGDVDSARTLIAVNRITVAVQSPSPTTPPSAGALTIERGPSTRVLTASQLAALPERTLNVTFEAGTASQSHVEIGPTLGAVLRAARIRADLDTWVAAVGSDGYVATATPAEAWIGARPLLISLNEDGTALAQPRLVTDGDIKGGRYVSDVVDLVIGHSPRPAWPWARAR